MAFSIRRIVTTNDADGKAVIATDAEIAGREGRPGTNIYNALMWTTETMPVDISAEDPAGRVLDIAPASNGTIFRILEIPAGAPPYMHRTETIDYVLILAGEIDMELDDSEVHMKAGDIMIQCGTNHAWANRGDQPCRIAFVLMDGKG